MPFAGYKDFKECVRKNQHAKSPEAYCAAVHKKATGKWPQEVAGDLEAAEAKTVRGFKSPEPGKLPKKGKDVLAEVYAKQREKGMGKERSSKIAWGAVKQAGFAENGGNVRMKNKMSEMVDKAPTKMSIGGPVAKPKAKDETLNEKGRGTEQKKEKGKEATMEGLKGLGKK